jgi:hypothetical protein
MNTKNTVTLSSDVRQITDPPFTQALFGKVNWAWLWLIVLLPTLGIPLRPGRIFHDAKLSGSLTSSHHH